MQHRMSHAERRIEELERDLQAVTLEKSRLSLRIAELEAAVIRLDEPKTATTSWWCNFD
jgi:predicted  nucleic acid-binding Zn-ribbon protein